MQVVVWTGTVVGKDKKNEFEEWMAENGFNATYLEEFRTLPDLDKDGAPIEDTGGRNDLLFTVSPDNMGKFSVWRLNYSMHWWENYLDSGAWEIVPPEVLRRYPYTWYNRPDKYSAVLDEE